MLYRGVPAQVTPEDIDIMVMRHMRWSYYDLQDCPVSVYQRIRQHMKAEQEAEKKHNQHLTAGSPSSSSGNNYLGSGLADNASGAGNVSPSSLLASRAIKGVPRSALNRRGPVKRN